jgi:hypothetical protein
MYMEQIRRGSNICSDWGNLAGFDAALASKQELPCAFT